MSRTNTIQVMMFFLISNNIFRNNHLRVFIFLSAWVILNVITEFWDNRNSKKQKLDKQGIIFIALNGCVFAYTMYEWIVFFSA